MIIVIAKYKEDINWVNSLSEKYIIYNKDEYDKNPEFINLPNKGREAHSYLTHIVNNYDNLDELTCFLQGNPFEHHVVNFETIKHIEFDDYLPLGSNSRCDINGHPQNPHLEMDKVFFEKYFLNKPQYITYCIGAQFVVKKEAILRRKKEFYQNLLEDFERDDIPELLTQYNRFADINAYNYIQKTGDNNRMPWLLERVWGVIFSREYKTKFDN